MAMRDVIKEAIEAGGATKESLLALTGTNDKGLASQMTYLRMTGVFPMLNDDGTYRLGKQEEWENRAASRGVGAGPADPVKRIKNVLGQINKKAAMVEKYTKNAENNPDNEMIQLDQQISTLQLKKLTLTHETLKSSYPEQYEQALEELANPPEETEEEVATGDPDETPDVPVDGVEEVSPEEAATLQ